MRRWVLLADIDGPAEIGQFDHVIDEDDVLGLEVAVDDSIFVEMHQGFYGLGYVVTGLDLWKVSFLPESVEKGAVSVLDQ